MRRLDGKIMIVAGGATGIGAATCERLASEGAAVVVGDINMAAAQATAARITAAGGNAVPVHCDIADEASVAAMVKGKAISRRARAGWSRRRNRTGSRSRSHGRRPRAWRQGLQRR